MPVVFFECRTGLVQNFTYSNVDKIQCRCPVSRVKNSSAVANPNINQATPRQQQPNSTTAASSSPAAAFRHHPLSFHRVYHPLTVSNGFVWRRYGVRSENGELPLLFIRAPYFLLHYQFSDQSLSFPPLPSNLNAK